MYPAIKRFFDIALSLIGGIVLSPLLLACAVAVKISSPGSVFFRQKRVGRNGKHFMMLKFRTMRTDAPKDVPTHLLTSAENYITPAGAFLRKSSLDELPQIFNILSGNMSIIGPRPALWNQFDLLELRGDANKLRPGLTGWAQINGRDEIPVELKAGYDREYAANFGFKMDFKIFIGSFSKVLKGSGVTA